MFRRQQVIHIHENEDSTDGPPVRLLTAPVSEVDPGYVTLAMDKKMHTYLAWEACRQGRDMPFTILSDGWKQTFLATGGECKITLKLLNRDVDLTCDESTTQHGPHLTGYIRIPTQGEPTRDVLNALTKACHEFHEEHLNKTDPDTIPVMDFNILSGVWTIGNMLSSRSWDSISLSGHLKQEIVNDLRMFQMIRERIKHIENAGRRIYLFQGPPGSGKSSMAAAIATELKSQLYRIRLSSLDDQALVQAMANLGKGGWDQQPADTKVIPVVLIEDADEAFMPTNSGTAGVEEFKEETRTQPGGNPLTEGISFPMEDSYSYNRGYRGVAQAAPLMRGKVTYSGILNALDGSDAPANALIIITSNRATSYDQAIMRRFNRYWHIAGVTEKSVEDYLRFALSTDKVDKKVSKNVATHMNKNGYQMYVLRECVIRAFYENGETLAKERAEENKKMIASEIPFPTPAGVLEILRAYVPLDKSVLVGNGEAEGNPLCK